jgi:RimJ/RimL family protein N-acetyltransferase
MRYVIETKRLSLRELTLDDADKLALVLGNPESMRFYPMPFDRDDVIRWISWNIGNYRTYGFGLWAVILKEKNELIGDCGITMQDIEGKATPEIGYHIRKEFCRNGYASEAAKACMDFAFERLGLESVVSYMKNDNLPSRGVAEKIGMKFVKNFEKHIRGETVTEALYLKESDQVTDPSSDFKSSRPME